MNFYEWKQYKLKDIIKFNPKESIKKGNHAKKIPMEMLEPFNKKINGYEETEFTSGSKFRNGDTLLARITPCLENGKTAYVDILDENEVAFGSTEYIVLREIEGITDKEFVYYLAISPGFRELAIKSMNGSSGRQRVQKDVLEESIVKLPLLQEQRKIAKILSELDKKIELNNKINHNLNKQMNELFKDTFINNYVGNIKEKSLYEFAEFINGTSFKANEYSQSGIPIVKISELKNGITDNTQYYNGKKEDKYYINDKQILFSWSGNPDTSIDIFVWSGGEAILNQHTFKIVTEDENSAFIYLLLKYFKPMFMEIARNKQTTGLGHVTISDLKRIMFPYDKVVIEKFNLLVSPFYNKYFNNMLENNKLNKIRDTLLPKLMNGEIDVSNISLEE